MSVLRALWLLLVAMPAFASGVGVEDLTAADGDQPPLHVRVWFPTDADHPDAMRGRALPLIVISHGTGAAIDTHADTAEALAQTGFVVAAVRHTGDHYRDRSAVGRDALHARPRHVSRAIDHLLTRWRWHTQLDPARIGVFGFSAGGFTALVLAGAHADLSQTAVHCRADPAAWDCGYLRRQGVDPLATRAGPSRVSAADPRVRAIVVAAPAVAYSFGVDGLRDVHVPVQLWGGEHDRIVADGAARVRQQLPAAEYHEVPGAGHFAFLAPCSWQMRALIGVMTWFGTEDICTDPARFDRIAFHRDFNRDVTAFFRARLSAGR